MTTKQTPVSYDINTIKSIASSNFNYTIDASIIIILEQMFKELGKTPNLLNSKNRNTNTNSSQTTSFNSRKKNKNMEITDDDEWSRIGTQPVENLKITKLIIAKEGTDASILKLRVSLNKLTDKNYIDIVEKITSILDEIIVINPLDLHKVGNIIFEIASQNRFYSKIYADLFSELISRYSIMNDIFQNNYNEYSRLFDSIEYIESTVDYIKFCDISKINETRKAISLFLVNLTKNGIIQKNNLFEVITKLFKDVLVNLGDSSKVNEINEIVENIVILFDIKLFEDFKEVAVFEDGSSIMFKIRMIAYSKPKEYVGLSIKTKFKMMDLIDGKINKI